MREKLSIVLLSAVALANAAFFLRVAAAYTIALPGDLDSIQRAAAILPFTSDSYAPDLSTQAGHLLDSQGKIAEGIAYYRKSLECDPYVSSTWLLVALAAERLEKLDEAEAAYRQAFRYEPNRAESYWMFANYLLRQDRTPESFAAFRELLKRSRQFDEPVFETVRHLASFEEIERLIVPAHRPAAAAYFRFALASQDASAAHRAWDRLRPEPGDIAVPEMDEYCRLLTSAGEEALSWKAWLDWARTRSGSGLIRNGDFESEPVGGPYDWTYHSSRALNSFRDSSASHSPNASAQVLFLGTGNYQGPALGQWLHLRPGHQYRVSFYWRSNNLTTDRAPELRISQGNRLLCSIATDPGTGPWRHEERRFRTGASAFAELTVYRQASQKLDNLIAGSFWLDDVELEEVENGN